VLQSVLLVAAASAAAGPVDDIVPGVVVPVAVGSVAGTEPVAAGQREVGPVAGIVAEVVASVALRHRCCYL